jgi:hypothetical protein
MAWICISPNDQRSTQRRVLVVSANDPPRAGVTDYEEAHQIQANANHAQRRAEEQRQAVPLCACDLCLEFEEAELPTFNSPQANLGAALARLQQANPSPEANTVMGYIRVRLLVLTSTTGAFLHPTTMKGKPRAAKVAKLMEKLPQSCSSTKTLANFLSSSSEVLPILFGSHT